jgi:hypothetical protein
MADPLRPVLGEGIDMAATLERMPPLTPEPLTLPSPQRGEGKRGGEGKRKVSGRGGSGAGGRTRGRSRPPRA